MASDETTLKTIHLTHDEDYEEGDAEARRVSRLSIESSDREDAYAELTSDDDVEAGNYRGCRRQRTRRERWLAHAWQMKKDQCGSNNRSSSSSSTNKEEINDHGDHCRFWVKPGGPDSGSICMDLDEIKACRELGIELPCDWTVEIPCGFSGIDSSSGGNSPIGNWRISSPGDDPKDVKARLKVWAQAVAVATATSLN